MKRLGSLIIGASPNDVVFGALKFMNKTELDRLNLGRCELGKFSSKMTVGDEARDPRHRIYNSP